MVYTHRHGGVHHRRFVARYHELFKPKTHLEIGTETGASLRALWCDTIAVDPAFKVDSNVIGDKSVMQFFQMTSDDFFARFDPEALLGAPLECAFLDGMHLYEYLLRDFLNTERSCSRDAVIFLHDCIPANYEMAFRTPMAPAKKEDQERARWWTGDVWKLIFILRDYRPDLKIQCLDCPPTGLVAVSNLDPGNRVLRDKYANIIQTYDPLTLSDTDMPAFIEKCSLFDSDALMSADAMADFFGK